VAGRQPFGRSRAILYHAAAAGVRSAPIACLGDYRGARPIAAYVGKSYERQSTKRVSANFADRGETES